MTEITITTDTQQLFRIIINQSIGKRENTTWGSNDLLAQTKNSGRHSVTKDILCLDFRLRHFDQI